MEFRFFYELNLAHKSYWLTKNFSETLQKDRNQLLKEKKQFEKIVEDISIIELFFKSIIKKTSKFDLLDNPNLLFWF